MNRLRELRREKDLTQKQLAEKIGLSQQVVGYYENEINQPSPDMLIRIADFFQCSIDYLLGREDDFGNVVVQNYNSTTPSLSPDEKKLIESYRALDMKNRMHVSAYVEIRLEEQGTDKHHRNF